jgi:endonuclease YncB( thermonuclease family)
MKRAAPIRVLLLMFLVLAAGPAGSIVRAQDTTSLQGTPIAVTGLPEGVQTATVAAIIDGDKFTVTIDGKTHDVNLIGADAPESGECYFDTSTRFLAKTLPIGATVYLEKDKKDKDKKNRWLRYAWIGNPKDGVAELVNVRVVRYGYASWVSKDGNTKYDAQIHAAQTKAQNPVDGIWDECGAAHAETPLFKCIKVPQATIDAITVHFTESFKPRLWKAVLARGNDEYPYIVAAMGPVDLMSDNSDPDVAAWGVNNLDNPTKIVTADIMGGAFTDFSDGSSLSPAVNESMPGYNEALACAGYVQPPDDDN